MKGTVVLLILLPLLLLGCSKQEDEIPDLVISDFSLSSKPGVAEWNSEDFIIDRYYSLIDTTDDVVNFSPSVAIKYQDGSNVNILWELNGIAKSGLEKQKLWQSEYQLWYILNALYLDSISLNYGDKVKAIVTIDNEKITRQSVISENKIQTDIFAVKFGMTKSEVEKCERKRINDYTDPMFREYQPNTSVLSYSTNLRKAHIAPYGYGGMTIYRFQNDKLVEVGEYVLTVTNPEIIYEYCERLGLKEVPQITADNLDKTYVWNNGKIEFKLSVIEDAPILNSVTRAIGISYKKYTK